MAAKITSSQANFPPAYHLGVRDDVGIVAAAEAHNIDLIAIEIEADQSLNDREHDRIVGPDTTVHQCVTIVL